MFPKKLQVPGIAEHQERDEDNPLPVNNKTLFRYHEDEPKVRQDSGIYRLQRRYLGRDHI
jgi:hypothetical protein